MKLRNLFTVLPPRKLFAGIAVAALFGMGMLAPASSEAANTAANATLRNTVTVSYKDAVGNSMDPISATVDITVALKAANPTVTAPSSLAATTDVNTGVNYSFTIATNANGPDNYTLSNGTPTLTGVATADMELRTASNGGGSVIGSVDLGATTAAAAVSLTATVSGQVTVLKDAVLTAGNINGIAALDRVLIGATTCTVDSVVASVGYGTTTMMVTCDANVSIAIGDPIREIQTVYLWVKPLTLTAIPIANSHIDITTTVLNGTPFTTVTTVNVPQLTVKKYVRNITDTLTTSNNVCGGSGVDAPITINTGGGAGNVQYCVSGRTGIPGDRLEYVIKIANGGAASATLVKISDPVPDYTTYVAGTLRLDPRTGTFGAIADTLNTPDAGEFDSGNKIVYFYPGTGGVDSPAGIVFGIGTGGTLATGETAYGSYRVDIK